MVSLSALSLRLSSKEKWLLESKWKGLVKFLGFAFGPHSHTVLINNYWYFLEFHSRDCLLSNVKKLSSLPLLGFISEIAALLISNKYKIACWSTLTFYTVAEELEVVDKNEQESLVIPSPDFRSFLEDVFTWGLQNIICIYKYRHLSSPQQWMQQVISWDWHSFPTEVPWDMRYACLWWPFLLSFWGMNGFFSSPTFISPATQLSVPPSYLQRANQHPPFRYPRNVFLSNWLSPRLVS